MFVVGRVSEEMGFEGLNAFGEGGDTFGEKEQLAIAEEAQGLGLSLLILNRRLPASRWPAPG